MRSPNEFAKIYNHLLFQQEQICSLALKVESISEQLRTKYPQCPGFTSRELSRLQDETKRLEQGLAQLRYSRRNALGEITNTVRQRLRSRLPKSRPS